MSNREQFEAWWKSEGYDEKLSCVQGIMFNHIKANMFFAWQAATSAIEAKCAALAADNDTAMAALKQADEVVKSAYEKYVALADENMALKSARQNSMTLPETPATDAFLAEVRAQGVEMLTADRKSEWMDSYIEDASEFAAQLRKGVQS